MSQQPPGPPDAVQELVLDEQPGKLAHEPVDRWIIKVGRKGFSTSFTSRDSLRPCVEFAVAALVAVVVGVVAAKMFDSVRAVAMAVAFAIPTFAAAYFWLRRRR